MESFQGDPFLTSTGRAQSQPPASRTSLGRTSVKGVGNAFRPNPSGTAPMILAPWSTFFTLMSLFTFAFHQVPVLVYAVAIIFAVCSALCHLLDRRSRVGGQWYLKLGLLCGIATIVASFLGMYNYAHEMAHFWTYKENQKYTNVLPTEPAAAHGDAGMIIFSDTARVDSTKAVGYKAGTVYCVAPILDDTQQTMVQFWAAGIDCCQQRADFSCDDAWNPKAKSGVVVIDPDSWLFPSPHKFYMRAIAEAEAAFDLVSAKKPLLIRWVADPEAVQADFWRGGFGFWLILSIIYLLISFLLAGIVQMTAKRSTPALATTLATQAV